MKKELLIKTILRNRNRIIDLVYFGKAGHPGGALSIIDVLTYIYMLEVDLASQNRTRVIMSKGHAVAAQYACLMEKGAIKEDEIKTFRTINSRLQGHPHTLSVPEVDATTGLLGQGLSIGVGMAFAKRLKKDKSKVYVVIGDGELNEGQNWESILQAAQFNLKNVVIIVDYNRLSSSGDVNKVLNLEPLVDKFKAFNWETLEINGHDLDQIYSAFEYINNNQTRPISLIVNTVKGKGVSFMENNPSWHSGTISDEQYAQAKNELNGDAL